MIDCIWQITYSTHSSRHPKRKRLSCRRRSLRWRRTKRIIHKMKRKKDTEDVQMRLVENFIVRRPDAASPMVLKARFLSIWNSNIQILLINTSRSWRKQLKLKPRKMRTNDIYFYTNAIIINTKLHQIKK